MSSSADQRSTTRQPADATNEPNKFIELVGGVTTAHTSRHGDINGINTVSCNCTNVPKHGSTTQQTPSTAGQSEHRVEWAAESLSSREEWAEVNKRLEEVAKNLAELKMTVVALKKLMVEEEEAAR